MTQVYNAEAPVGTSDAPNLGSSSMTPWRMEEWYRRLAEFIPDRRNPATGRAECSATTTRFVMREALAHADSATGEFYVVTERWAKLTGLSTRSVKRYIARLAELGLIRQLPGRRRGKFNQWKVCADRTIDTSTWSEVCATSGPEPRPLVAGVCATSGLQNSPEPPVNSPTAEDPQVASLAQSVEDSPTDNEGEDMSVAEDRATVHGWASSFREIAGPPKGGPDEWQRRWLQPLMEVLLRAQDPDDPLTIFDVHDAFAFLRGPGRAFWILGRGSAGGYPSVRGPRDFLTHLDEIVRQTRAHNGEPHTIGLGRARSMPPDSPAAEVLVAAPRDALHADGLPEF